VPDDGHWERILPGLETNMIDYALLGLLREQPDYGYRLRRRFEDLLGGIWTLNIGQVYQTLQHLKRRGLVMERPPGPIAGGRQRRFFEVTPKGLRALERWLRRPPSRVRPVHDETLLWLHLLGPEPPGAAHEHIGRLEMDHRELLDGLRTQSPEAGLDDAPRPVRRLGLEAAILHTEAQLRWLAQCRRYLEGGHDTVFPARAGPA
jgi:DNA-binding PadR family transcriptional regulator